MAGTPWTMLVTRCPRRDRSRLPHPERRAGLLRPSTLRRRAAVSGATTLLAGVLLLPALPAAAHGQIVQANPSSGTTVTARLEEVRLTFDEAPLRGYENAHRIRVISPSGLDVSTGSDRIEDSDLVKAVQPDRTGLYTVRWSAVSEDTHPVSGSYTFTYTGPVTAAPPGATVAGPATTANASPLLPFIVTVGGTAVLAGVAVAIVLLLGRRRARRQ